MLPLLAIVLAVQPPADAIYLHARIWTGDSAHPSAEALAVRGDRLLAVGSAGEIRKLRGPRTRVIDLGGRRVVPGFIDSHWHLPGTARADLTDAGSPAVIVRRLQQWARTLPADAWILGRGWTPSDFPNNAPHRRALDAAFPTRPVVITDRDGHQTIANAEALRRAGVTRETTDPPRGRIDRDASGTPTGLLKEGASGLVTRLIPPPSAAEIAQRIDAESRAAARFGLTLLQEASGNEPNGAVIAALRRADSTQTLRTRFRVSIPFSPTASDSALRRYAALRDAHAGPWLRFGIAKGMLDGTVDAKTAAMLAPYEGTQETGLPFWPDSLLQRGVARYDSAGLQVELHAIGDRAVRMALDAFAEAGRRNGSSGRRHRVEHLEVPELSDLPRFAALGVIASTQAIFASPDETTLRNYAPLLGPARSSHANAFKLLDEAGAVQAFGSDYPVFPMDVLRGIYTAVTRQMPDGSPAGGWYPANRITVEAALRHFTRDAAYAAFMERELGSLEPGKLADFVVLSEDILSPAVAAEPRRILGARVVRRVIGGR
jgi:hypothetical protein